MARYILTFGTDRIAGSKGGSTFQKSGSTFVIRKRNVPVQKKTPGQTAKQNIFASVQQNWRKLSAEEKESFAAESINYLRVDSLGNEYFINGQNMQSSSNISLVNSGQDQITEIAPPSAIPQVFTINAQLSLASNFFGLSVTPDPVPVNSGQQIFASMPLAEPVTGAAGAQIKLITTLPAGASAAVNIWNEYTAIYGQLSNSVNKYVHVMIRYVQLNTGQVGESVTFPVQVNP